MKSIGIFELLKLNNPNIIDIRNNYEYTMGHIAGSINISGNELINNHYKYLNKNKVYYIYCQTGSRSKVIVNKLSNLGYNVVNVSGGYDSYLFRS